MAKHQVSGKVVLLAPPGVPAQGAVGATVEIIDLDVGGNGDDRIFGPFVIATPNGGFSGQTSEWKDRNTRTESVTALGVTTSVTVSVPDIPVFQVVIKQAAFVAVFPVQLLLNPFPTFIVPWGPDLLTGTPDRQHPVVVKWCKDRVKQARQRYEWSTYDFASVGFCRQVPGDALPPPEFLARRVVTQAEADANENAVTQAFAGSTFGDSIADYTNQYLTLASQPAVIPQYKNDRTFAAQRLIGPNPMMIARVAALPSDFPVNDSHIDPAIFPGLTLQHALSTHRAFLLDYDILANVARTNGSRYLPAPYALFIASTDRKSLVPVAIQIERNFDPVVNPIYTPRSPAKHWQRAKLMVQVADGSAHELRYHLFNAHMTMEVVAVAMQRNLCPLHPLKQLVDRHLMGLLITNNTARSSLINDGGPVDRLIGTGLAGSKKVLFEAHKRWKFSMAGLPDDLHARGLDDPATSLADFPLRDDGMQIWRAIEKYVSEYVGIDYATDKIIKDDYELQGWVSEIGQAGKGGLLGVPAVLTKGALVKFLTTIIYTCSAYHSTVNYPQYDYIGFVPNMPGASWARPLPPPRGTDEDQELEFLPPLSETTAQVNVMWSLSGYRYDKLGHYRDEVTGHLKPFFDVKREIAAGKFRAELDNVAAQITTRNNARSLKSLWLHPKFILNSISM